MGEHKRSLVSCKTCNITFLARNAELRKGNGLYCSRSCKNDGDNNPNYKGGQLTNYEYKLRAKEKAPEKFEARRLLHLAVKRGELIRGSCEVCGDSNAEGHHEDYTKPLDVKWLCRLHHIAKHKA